MSERTSIFESINSHLHLQPEEIMSLARARQILTRHYPERFHPEDIQPVERTGFSGALLLRMKTRSRWFCLRRWPAVMSVERLRTIHRVIRHVAGRGLECLAVPVASLSGESWVEEPDGLWQLEPWMPGVPDDADQPDVSRLRAAATELARWHHAAESFVEEPDSGQKRCAERRDDVSPAIRERLVMLLDLNRNLTALEAGLRGEPDAAFQNAGQQLLTLWRWRSDNVRRSLESASEVPVPLQYSLRDVWSEHLLFTGSKLTGLIDYGAVRIDSVTCDLARWFGSLTLLAQSRAAALEAYEQLRPLSPAESALLEPLEQSGLLLSGMVWLRRRYIERSLTGDLSRITARLQTMNQRLSPPVLILPD